MSGGIIHAGKDVKHGAENVAKGLRFVGDCIKYFIDNVPDFDALIEKIGTLIADSSKMTSQQFKDKFIEATTPILETLKQISKDTGVNSEHFLDKLLNHIKENRECVEKAFDSLQAIMKGLPNSDDVIKKLKTAVFECSDKTTEQLREEFTKAAEPILKELNKIFKDTGEDADKLLTKLLNSIEESREAVQVSLNALNTESQLWRNLIERSLETTKQAGIAFGRSTKNTLLYTGVSSFFGTLSRRTAAYYNCSQEIQNNVEFVAYTLAGTGVAVGSKITQLRPDALALRAASYLMLPVIKRGLEMGGYGQSRALMYAVTVKTIIDMYADPTEAISTYAGFFVGNAIGGEIGAKSAEAVANLLKL